MAHCCLIVVLFNLASSLDNNEFDIHIQNHSLRSYVQYVAFLSKSFGSEWLALTKMVMQLTETD